MAGQRHLVECHCILPLYKERQPPVYHKFAVYSVLDEKTGKVEEKYVTCNNCGVTHLVKEFCKSEIRTGKENLGSIRSIDEVKISIPAKINQILEPYNATIDIYEEIEDVLENSEYPRQIVIKREIIDEKYHLKILNIIANDRFKILSEVLEDTIQGESL